MVRRFREASLKGWGYALQHPDEIAARIVAEPPLQVAVSDPAGFTRYQTEVARKLARYPDVPLGHSNPERWSRIQQSLIAIGEITRPADLDTFLYNPGAAARYVPLAGGFRRRGRRRRSACRCGLLWRWGQGRSALASARPIAAIQAARRGVPDRERTCRVHRG